MPSGNSLWSSKRVSGTACRYDRICIDPGSCNLHGSDPHYPEKGFHSGEQLSRGIIIADTKFEFGLDENGNVVLGDEMLTPDSSRFWPLEGYEAGHGQPSFDKQFVRNWLKANPDSNYDLPQDVIDKTIEKYLEAYEMLTGKKL